jgi:hypothetical protein
VDDKKLIDELAQYTDELFAGQAMQTSVENQELAHLVRQLHALIATDDEPSPEFKTRLQNRVLQEWRRTDLATQTQHIIRRRLYRWGAIVAGIVVVIGVGLVLGSTQDKVQGTASRGIPLEVVGIGIAVAIGVVIFVLWQKRR